MKFDKKLEFRRKAFHICLGILIILLAIFISQVKWILFYTLIAGMILSILSIFYKLPLINFLLEKFERPNYIRTFPGKGALFFIAGSLLVLKLFSKEIAIASIAILALTDPFFSLEKRAFKGIFKVKTLKSLLLGLIAGTIAASLFVSPFKAFAASLIATLVESFVILLGTDHVDDNIIVPLTAGTILYLIQL